MLAALKEGLDMENIVWSYHVRSQSNKAVGGKPQHEGSHSAQAVGGKLGINENNLAISRM